MTDQTPDLAALEALAEAATDPDTVLWLIREVERLRESIAGSPDKAQRLVFALLGGE